MFVVIILNRNSLNAKFTLMSDYMEKPCKHCPYRNDVIPFLHPERGEQLAYLPLNPYTEFHCHKTTEYDEDSDDGEMMVTDESKLCAGFLTLRANDDDRFLPEGFEPSFDMCYADAYEMSEAYEEEWNRTHEM